MNKASIRGLVIKKLFLRKKAWDVLKYHMKWLQVKRVDEESPPPSSKQTKTSSSNAYTTSLDAQFPPGFNQQHQKMNSPPQRQQKRKKAASEASTSNEIVDLVNEIVGIHTVNKVEVEDRKRYWMKTCVLNEKMNKWKLNC